MAHVTVQGLTARVECLVEWATYVVGETTTWLENFQSAQNDLQHLSNVEVRNDLSKRLITSRRIIRNLEELALNKIHPTRNVKQPFIKIEPEEDSVVLNSPLSFNYASLVDSVTQTDLPVRVVPEMKSVESQTKKAFVGHWVTTSLPTLTESTPVSTSDASSTQSSLKRVSTAVILNGLPLLPVNSIQPPTSSEMRFDQQTYSTPRNKYPRPGARQKSSLRCSECSRQVGNTWNLEMHMRSRHPQAYAAQNSPLRSLGALSTTTAHLRPSGTSVTSSTPSISTLPTEVIIQSRQTRTGMRLRNRGQVGTQTTRYDPSIYAEEDSPRVRKPLHCPCCSKMLSNSWNLIKHVRSKHPQYQASLITSESKPSYENSFVSESMKASVEKEPMQAAQEGLACLQCGKHFPNGDREALERHVASRHARGKRHACDQCPMRFVTRSELECHHRKHTGEQPFQCEHCQRRFTHRSTLQKHIYGQHERMRRFTCDECGKRFNLATRLDAHLKTAHTTVQLPFRCRWCDLAFRQKSTLSRHENARHAGQELTTTSVASG